MTERTQKAFDDANLICLTAHLMRRCIFTRVLGNRETDVQIDVHEEADTIRYIASQALAGAKIEESRVLDMDSVEEDAWKLLKTAHKASRAVAALAAMQL